MVNRRLGRHSDPTEKVTRGQVVNELFKTWEGELDRARMRPVSPRRRQELRMIGNAIEVLKQTYAVSELMDLNAC